MSAVPLCITGATGENAYKLNGVYKPVPGDLHNGHAIFAKAGEFDWWLLYTTDHAWALSNTHNMNSMHDCCFEACSVERGVALPQNVTSWQVPDGLKLKEQPSLRVSTVR